MRYLSDIDVFGVFAERGLFRARVVEFVAQLGEHFACLSRLKKEGDSYYLFWFSSDRQCTGSRICLLNLCIEVQRVLLSTKQKIEKKTQTNKQRRIKIKSAL